MGLRDFFFNCLNPIKDTTLDSKPWAAPTPSQWYWNPQATGPMPYKAWRGKVVPVAEGPWMGSWGGRQSAPDQLLLLPLPPSQPQNHPSQSPSLTTKLHSHLITTQGAKGWIVQQGGA